VEASQFAGSSFGGGLCFLGGLAGLPVVLPMVSAISAIDEYELGLIRHALYGIDRSIRHA